MRIFIGVSLEDELGVDLITHRPQLTTTNAPMMTIRTGNQTMPPCLSYCTTSSSRRLRITTEPSSAPSAASGPRHPGRTLSERTRHSNAEHEQRTINQA